MIIEADSTEVVTNIDASKTIPMGISLAGMAHVMTTLTNLYNDPETAVIREYTANAIDSHIASGQTRPIEVTLPDRYTNQFIVEDWGLGMSAKEIDDVYRLYGESTKRKSNSQIGAFGLGAKSALAIASQFTVRSIKDGHLVTVLIQKSPDGLNTRTILAERETDEPNGVKVSIPVEADKINAFNDKAKKFFRFSEPSLILVDGEHPKSIFDNVSQISDPENPDFVGYLSNEEYSTTSYVVMGGVPYAISDTSQRESMDRLDLSGTYKFYSLPKIFPVAIGSVDLTPNREGLRYTDRTIATFDALMRSFYTGLKATAQAQIDAVEDRWDAYAVINEWKDRLAANADEFTWNGEPIVNAIKLEKPVARISRSGWSEKNDHSTTYRIELDLKTKTVFVVGRGPEKYKRVVAYLADYLRMREMRGREVNFIFAEELTEEMDTPWLLENSKFEFTDYDTLVAEVKAYRKSLLPPKDPNEPKERVKILYPVIDVEKNSYEQVEAKDIPDGAFLVSEVDFGESSVVRRFFVGTSSYSQVRPHERVKSLERLTDAFPEVKHLVFLSKTRKQEVLEKKAKQTFRTLVEFKDAIVDEIKALAADDSVKYARWVEDYADNEMMFMLAAHPDMLDPMFTDLLPDPAAAEKAKRLGSLLALKDDLRFITGSHVVGTEYYGNLWDINRPFHVKYPLLKQVSIHGSGKDTMLQHLVTYVNAHYSTLVQSDQS